MTWAQKFSGKLLEPKRLDSEHLVPYFRLAAHIHVKINHHTNISIFFITIIRTHFCNKTVPAKIYM